MSSLQQKRRNAEKNARRAARMFAARDGIAYVAARRQMHEAGVWGRGTSFYEDLLAVLDRKEMSLKDLVDEVRAPRSQEVE
ncbi:hypothetical protein [Kribbella sindirgiensis]|uniref:Uncharacterized protein n=1 Tax=Kribbella sindirgiensis TaxID=1124744 RepID=A0A4R0IR53_9ACTN|nr:hypothetical protein [Kribbella sindirgiensis]TCC35100.1 hypothetical protein E0H50_14635 [Kribbella sindirgiensis]